VSVALDDHGILYVADLGNNVVRAIDYFGLISTAAGTGTAGYSGDGADPRQAELNEPSAVSFGPQGQLYIADSSNQRIRKVEAGVITTVAGDGVAGYAGDGGGVLGAEFNQPWWVAASPVGDHENNRIRLVVPATGLLEGTVTVTTPDGAPGPSWQAAVDVPWVTLSETSGIGPSNITVSVDPSAIPCTDFGRGTITFSATGSLVTKTVSVVVQNGQGQ
jgi:hypothetical protein